MKKLNCLILENQPLALGIIEKYINKTSFLELKGKCSNAVEAMEIIDNDQIDLLFVDVQIPDLNSLYFSWISRKGARILYTTVFQEFAFTGLRKNILDFILNPIRYKEFLKTVNKTKQEIDEENNS